MDFLYITSDTKKELLTYCEDDLVSMVFTHFEKVGKIIKKNNNEKPSRWWIITDYISNHTIDSRKKLSVILSYARIGGYNSN